MSLVSYTRNASRQKLFRQQWISILLNRGIYDVGQIQQYLVNNLAIKEVTTVTIHSDIREIEERAEKTLIDEFAEARIKLLNQHQYLYTEALEAWDKSKKEQVTETEEETPQGYKHKVTKTKSAGGAQYLATAQAQLDRMAKLMGLDAPTKVDIEQSLPDGISLEQALAKLANIIEQKPVMNDELEVKDEGF